MFKKAAWRYGGVGLALMLSALILGGVFALLQGEASPTAAQHAIAVSSPDTLGATFEAAGIVISPTRSGEVFFNNFYPGVLTLTFTLTGTTPLTLTAEPAFGTGYVLTSPVAPWEAVLTYTVGVTAGSQPHTAYSFTQNAMVSATTTVITYTRDITAPLWTFSEIDLLADSGMVAEGMVLYYTHTLPGNLFFVLQGNSIDHLSGPGMVTATPALGTDTPVNSGTWDDWLFTYRIPSGIIETGHITVTAADAVENHAQLVFSYIHDPSPPNGTVQIANGAAYISTTQVSLQLTADDGPGCGVADMCLSNTAVCGDEDWVPFSTTVADWELAAGDGERNVYVWYRDHLGNTSALIQALAVLKDQKPPTVTVTAPSRVGTPRVDVSWTAEDDGSGLATPPSYTVAYREDSGAWINWLPNTPLTHTTFTSDQIRLDHSYVFSVTVRDRAGNLGAGTASTLVKKYWVYLPLAVRSWVWWYAKDIYERNDTPAEAWGPLASEYEIEAYIWDATDRDDYYFFQPSTAGQVKVSLSNIPSDVDYDLYIYYHDGNAYQIAAYSNLTGSPTEAVEFLGTAGRRYFIRVYPYSGFSSTQPYSLIATYP